MSQLFLLWEPKKFKMTARGPQNGQQGLEGCFGHSRQLSQNKFLFGEAALLEKVVTKKSGGEEW